MINITRSGNNVIVTSDNPKAFNISNGELSVPMNSIYYVLDEESDFIQFNSIDEKGEILFNGVIGDIQVNGTLVTRDDIQVQLDSVFNTSSGSGGNSGVESVNGMTGAVTLKTINGQELTGLGDITIEGGSVTESDPVFTSWKNGSSIAAGNGSAANTNSVNIGYDNGTASGGAVMIGSYLTGNTSSIMIGVDTKSNNDTEILLGVAAKSNTGDTDADKTHVAFAKYGASYGNYANCFEIRQDNSVYIWNADNTEMIKLQDNLGGGSSSSGVESIDTGGIYFKGALSISTSEVSDDSSWRVGLNGDMYDSSTNEYYGEGGSMIFGIKSSDNSILVSDGGSLADLKVNEWVGTQSEYDALGTYNSGCTYYITE